MGRHTPTAAGTSFADMLEARIGAGPFRAQAQTAPPRPPRDEVAGPTWDWISTAALDASRQADLGAARRYVGGEAAATPDPTPASPRPDALHGLDPAQRRAMRFFHDLGEIDLHAGSDARALKRAYRRLARRLHPDAAASALGAVRPDAGTFIELRRNYELLSDRLAA